MCVCGWPGCVCVAGRGCVRVVCMCLPQLCACCELRLCACGRLRMCCFGMPGLCVCGWQGCVGVAATAAMCVLCVCSCHRWVHVVNWSCVCVDDPGCVALACQSSVFVDGQGCESERGVRRECVRGAGRDCAFGGSAQHTQFMAERHFGTLRF